MCIRDRNGGEQPDGGGVIHYGEAVGLFRAQLGGKIQDLIALLQCVVPGADKGQHVAGAVQLGLVIGAGHAPGFQQGPTRDTHIRCDEW